jgi:trans-2,3-dihydro-3-hydroxyanthranilate isomerase
MVKLTFYTVDVFAEEKYAGNQLAVFRNAKSISDSEMQRIAREINYSETTFIASDEKREGGYDVRIFTPGQEVPFAGHPTLGTAYVIQREIIGAPIETIILNLKVGQIPVTVTYTGKRADVLWMKQKPPTFTQTLDASKVADVLQLDKKDIDDRFPIQEVSTGLPFIIVPLKTISALKKARVNRDKYFALVENTEAKAILIFCPETHIKGNDLSVRVFVDYFGIPEDPATGSGNGRLAGYLVNHSYFGKKEIGVRVEQGYEIGRPSLPLLRAKDDKGRIDVSVGGKVVMVAKGEFI